MSYPGQSAIPGVCSKYCMSTATELSFGLTLMLMVEVEVTLYNHQFLFFSYCIDFPKLLIPIL